MKEKVTWFEIFWFIDNEFINGTETIETFDTLEEAETYVEKNKQRGELYIDEWESNEDGTGVAKRIFKKQLKPETYA